MRFHALLLAATAVIAPITASGTAKAQDLVVFAAASMKNALDEINAQWPRGASGGGVKASYAASSALARQIEAGAPADLFISADLAWMDYLDEKTLLKPGTRGNLLGNAIVLVAPAGSKASITIAPGFDLVGLLGRDGKLAMADTNAVPAGKYGKAALEALKVWPSVQARVAQAENVRAALALVGRGEAPAGIVYATDAAADAKNVRVLGAFPANSHPPIVYPAAVTAASTHAQARAYLAFLRGPAAKAVFETAGFTVLPAQAATN